MLHGIKAVFFDLDDTLCAYWEAAKAALAETFDRYAPAGTTPEELNALWAKEFAGYCHGLKKTEWFEAYLKTGEPSRTELMRRALFAAGVDDAALAREVSDFYAASRRRRLALFEDALPVLRSLRERGLYLGMITNGPADIQREEVVDLGLEPLFDTILIEGELGFGKPQRQVFELAEKASNCKPNEILFVGNSYAHDILPAIHSGWRTMWVRRESDIPPSRDGEGARLEDMPPGSPAPDLTAPDLSALLAS